MTVVMKISIVLHRHLSGPIGLAASRPFCVCARTNALSSCDFKNSQVRSVIYSVLEKNPTTFPKMTHLKCNNIFFKGPPAAVVVDHAQVPSSCEKVSLRPPALLEWFADCSGNISEYLQRWLLFYFQFFVPSSLASRGRVDGRTAFEPAERGLFPIHNRTVFGVAFDVVSRAPNEY